MFEFQKFLSTARGCTMQCLNKLPSFHCRSIVNIEYQADLTFSGQLIDMVTSGEQLRKQKSSWASKTNKKVSNNVTILRQPMLKTCNLMAKRQLTDLKWKVIQVSHDIYSKCCHPLRPLPPHAAGRDGDRSTAVVNLDPFLRHEESQRHKNTAW